MKNIRSVLIAIFAAAATPMASAQVAPPTAPQIEDALKLRGPNILLFQPVRMHATHSLDVTQIRRADGSVRPGEQRGILFVVYAAKANVDGHHAIYFQDFHFLSNEGSPVLNFEQFIPQRDAPAAAGADNRVGVICALIGLLRDQRTGQYRAAPLPVMDSVSMQVTPGDTGVGFLVPAVRKARVMAAGL
jgi:hypothetical protein